MLAEYFIHEVACLEIGKKIVTEMSLMNMFIRIMQNKKETKTNSKKQQYTAHTSLHTYQTSDSPNHQLNIAA